MHDININSLQLNLAKFKRSYYGDHKDYAKSKTEMSKTDIVQQFI